MQVLCGQHPQRVFKNTTNYGGKYPTQAMKVIGSLWNGTWASRGGVDVNWKFGTVDHLRLTIEDSSSMHAKHTIRQGSSML